VVAGVGNDASTVQFNPKFPATIGGIIRAGTHGYRGDTTKFVPVNISDMDAATMGEDILSTWHDGGYRKLTGVSIASPFVASLCAMLLAFDIDLHGEAGRRIKSTHCMRHLLHRFSFPCAPEVARGKGMSDLSRLWDVVQLFEYELDRIC